MNQVRVSVIVPAYNSAQWLASSIGSVLAQTMPDLEVIIINDGSTDGTAMVAAGFHDPRVRVLHQQNAGVSAARNNGLEHAQGMFVCFLDADDGMEPDNLQIKLEALKDPAMDWVFGDLIMCDQLLEPTGAVLQGTGGDVLRTILLGTHTAVPAPCSNILVRRRCFDHGIRFDTQLSNSADQDIAIQLASIFRYQHIPIPLNRYRVLPASMSRDIGLYQKDHLALINKAIRSGLLNHPGFRRTCLANANWSIGGSWWLNAGQRRKALPFLIKAILMRPMLLLRPFRRS